jgi:hypothetical protein
MPPQPRMPSGGDSAAAGRARQHLKISALGYYASRHGIDADEARVKSARDFVCQIAIVYAEAVMPVKNRRTDLYRQTSCERLLDVAIAYGECRHGNDADVGMTREGMAMLCQEAVNFYEALPLKEDAAKRSTLPPFQLGTGMRP